MKTTIAIALGAVLGAAGVTAINAQTKPPAFLVADITVTDEAKFKVEPGNERYPEDRWYAWLKEEWVRIPPEKIVPDHAPDGQAYLFLLAGTVQCFVRPKGGL